MRRRKNRYYRSSSDSLQDGGWFLGGWCLLFAVLWLPLPSFADPQTETDDLVKEAREGSQIGPRRGNWVAVPIPVSNPTLGTGLQLAVMYLHPKRLSEDGAPNSTSGLGAMYTNTGSWFAGGFHNDSWDNGRYRFTGFVGEGEMKLRFYGIGGYPAGNRALDYSLGISILYSQFQVRLPYTDYWYAGLKYLYTRTESIFDLNSLFPGLPPTVINVPIRAAGLGMLLTYDSRDDNYNPKRGQLFEFSWTNFSDTWGGDVEFNKALTTYNYYLPLNNQTTLAMRTRWEVSSEDAPFFFLSTLAMRGFSRDRYLDSQTLSVHAEARHKFAERWGVVAFTEAGWFADSFSGLSDSRTIISYGAGVRWQATREKSLNLALDFAISSDDRAVYFKIGEAF